MKITLLLVLLSYSSISLALDCEDENNLAKIAKGFTYPNCNTSINIQAFKSRNKEKLCTTCKAEFEIVNGKISQNANHLQEEFLHSALNEYKKNVTNNLLNSIKMKVLYSTGANFEQSIKDCKMKTASDFAKECGSPAAVKLLSKTSFFDDLSKELSNDVAKFLSSDSAFNPQPTLLKRSEQSCSIPERDVLLMSASTYEEALDKNLIEAIKSIDPKKYKTVSDLLSSDEFMDNYEGDIAELKDSLYNHPLFSPHIKSSEKFISFLKGVKTPADIDNLRKALYSKENGLKFDAELANSCKTSAKVLKDAICSPDFEKGNLSIEPTENFDKLKISQSFPTDETLASTEELVDTNIKLLELCENKKSKDKKSLSLINSEIGYALNDNQKSLNISLYKTEKYNSEVGSLTKTLCSMTDQTCQEGTIACSIYKKIKERNKNGSATFKLANSSNNEVNALLRSMIGDTSKIDAKTKEVLIAQGIIPKENGELVAQADVDRKPDSLPLPNNLQNQSNNVATGKTAPVTPGATNLASKGRAPANDSSSNSNNSYSNVDANSSAANSPDFSDLMEDQQELRGIQDEIKRRLLGMPDNKPASLNEAKKITRDAFKARKQPLTPEMENAFADRMMERPDTQSNFANTNGQSPDLNQGNRASVSGGETATEKWRKGQEAAALMGMAGAQKVLGKDKDAATAANDAKPKDLTKVALNISDDPQVKLSDIFNKKIDQNDSETQLLKVLLRNKNNFLLQIKSMNFKVVFDEKKNFNILLESGDRQEAERIRPQLEMFLKKLKT